MGEPGKSEISSSSFFGLPSSYHSLEILFIGQTITYYVG